MIARTHPRTDVVTHYEMVPEDFVKHLLTTLAVVAGLVLVAALLFGVPEQPPLTVQGYATQHPVTFEEVALRALDGQGRIANYGPPYNHGTGNVESPIQTAVGILHPVNASQDFILHPLKMASAVNPAITPVLTRFEQATPAQKARWEAGYTTALTHGVYRHGQVLTPAGSYGPLPQLLNDTLHLGQSGLMSGALTRNSAVDARFDNQNFLLFLQGTPLHQAAQPLQLGGTQWGIIHPAVKGYPGAWWMTIPTWIYQWPFVANSAANDALALSIGFLFWLALALTPWIPGWNRLPRYMGIHRLIWKDFYRHQADETSPKTNQGGAHHAS